MIAIVEQDAQSKPFTGDILKTFQAGKIFRAQRSSFPRSCVGMQTEPTKNKVGIPTEDGGKDSQIPHYHSDHQ
ncbi:MAG: hypothetical protein RQ715_11930 [Methylococcales bacterium]|nr:hypothetical protein [Methylococcales bacterium]